MQEIKIGDNKYPVSFDLLAIESVCTELGEDDINNVAASLGGKNAKMGDVSKAIKMARACALAGIEGGYRKLNEPCPITEQFLIENVKSIPDMMVAVELFSVSFAGFFSGVTEKK